MTIQHINSLCTALCLCGLLAIFSVAKAAPKNMADDLELCDHAARYGSTSEQVPLEILRALTRTETGRSKNGRLTPWPWTVNMEGEGFWFDTRQEALEFVLDRHAAGARSFDVGCFQINYRWHGDGFSSIEAMFDPKENARYAARFIADLKSEGRDWIGAAGAYHSRTPKFAGRYKKRFKQILAKLAAPPALDRDFANTRLASIGQRPESRSGSWPQQVSDASPVRGGIFAALPAHSDVTLQRRNWRGGVAMSVFANEERHLLTRARPLCE